VATEVTVCALLIVIVPEPLVTETAVAKTGCENPVPEMVDPTCGVVEQPVTVSVVLAAAVPVHVASVVAKAARDNPPPSEHPPSELPSAPEKFTSKSQVVLSDARRRLTALPLAVA